ncbi:MAG: molecular chaperone TorD family protein [Eggerthellaceae bacterium]|nr:molecular chaperone TorD family protein [Eggerthellaceae bacterium]
MERALAELARTAERLAALPRREAVRRIATEYTKLFVGPGTPVAPPWESLHREGGKYPFGQPTFDMKQALREHGLGLDDGAHQLEDHLGVELIYLAAMSERFAQQAPSAEDVVEQVAFVREYPLRWIGELHDAAQLAFLGGYYASLFELAWGGFWNGTLICWPNINYIRINGRNRRLPMRADGVHSPNTGFLLLVETPCAWFVAFMMLLFKHEKLGSHKNPQRCLRTPERHVHLRPGQAPGRREVHACSP